MLFSNGRLGQLIQIMRRSPFVEEFDFPGQPIPPPVPCFLVDQAGDFIITMADNSNVLVHCEQETSQVIDYLGNRVITYNDMSVQAIHP
jgi:hypothetical protein